VQKVLEEILLCWQQPVYSDVFLISNDQNLDFPNFRNAEKGKSGIDIGDIRPGRPLFIFGRTTIKENDINISLESAKSGTIAVSTAEKGDENLISSLMVLFGDSKIQALEFILQSGNFGKNWDYSHFNCSSSECNAGRVEK